jgi:DNA mismatch repair protein MutS
MVIFQNRVVFECPEGGQVSPSSCAFWWEKCALEAGKAEVICGDMAGGKGGKETPLMQQYNSIKAQYPGALLLFRVGDFYETFGEDARTASAVLGIVLTKRANGAASEIELAGFPHHSLDSYLPRLVRAGHRVAICDQLEDPKMTKTIVKRGVTELVTPGVSVNDKVLEARENNYLAAWQPDGENAGLALLDVSTGEFLTAEGDREYMRKLLQGFKPSEILLTRQSSDAFGQHYGTGWLLQFLDEWVFSLEYAEDKLNRHFGVSTLKGFGIGNMPLAITAAGSILHYLEQTRHSRLGHLTGISRIERDHYLWLDGFTLRNLEVIQPIYPGGRCLLEVLDRTRTPMGARMMRHWLSLPLKEKARIAERHDTVEWLINHPETAENLRASLQQIGDLQRLAGKVALGRISPRETVQLARSLRAAAALRKSLMPAAVPAVKRLAEQINPCESISSHIESSLNDDAPAIAGKGGIVKTGVLPELDELRALATSGKDYLAALQRREAENTGITSLKVAFNNVFGYYIEVTHVHRDKVPAEWIRKQTLTNAERYITPELKEYEDKILNAEDRILGLETSWWENFVQELADAVPVLQLNAQVLARIDCLSAFAEVSREFHYVRPQIHDDRLLEIKGLRHPVIERQLPPGESYIPNDILLDDAEQRMIILTGPNMSGKSAILRQTALAVLMAQAGCFIPCIEAHIGLTDKIYTRVGASDNISLGESTFMVEMIETASILNNLSDRSLILLDEIGRGTSTYDGISLAWSIAEFLANDPRKPKTIFATHYHELNELEAKLEGVRNYHVSIREDQNKIVFLRKLKPGGSEHSFGIHVARMAGIPARVTSRAVEILQQLEEQRTQDGSRQAVKKLQSGQGAMQLQMFALGDPVLAEIRSILESLDIDRMAPVEALLRLHEIRQLLAKA